MIILDLVQGSDAWAIKRAQCRNASEAASMMGDSPKMKRNELIAMKATGTPKEVSDWVQKFLFDKGHVVEANARVLLEEDLGQDLYPVTATCDNDYLLMSSDGMDIAFTFGFEHKMWNEELAVAVRNQDLPPEYYWQLEQQILVSGVEFIIFMVSDGTRSRREYFEYFPVPGRAEKLVAGWAQFDADLANYTPPVKTAEVKAKKLDELPQLIVKLTGEVSNTNLPAFKAQALKFIETINTELTTDQHFADADNAVKFCDRAEKELAQVKVRALDETKTIKELFETIDELSAAMRTKRLTLSKLVEARKKAVKLEIQYAGQKAFDDHIAAINAEIGPRVRMPVINIDVAGVMANKRNIASIQDAVDTEVARCKIEANEIASVIRINLATLRELPAEHRSLFLDANDIVQKPADDFANVVQLRINEFNTAEALRVQQEEEALEAAREKIRKEEREKLEREEQARKDKEARERAAAEEEKTKKEAEARLADEEKARKAAEPVAVTPAPEAVIDEAPLALRTQAEPVAEARAATFVAPEATGTAGPATQPVAEVTDYATSVKTTFGNGTRPVVARLENMTALIQAVADGHMPQDLLSINVTAVANYLEECGHVPTGFSLASAD